MIGKVAVAAKVAGAAKTVVNTVKKLDADKVGKAADSINAISNVKDKFQSPKKKSRAEAMEDLKKLKELLDLGVLTEEEFTEKKKKLLELI